jgi:hypothetical protein
LDCITAYIDLHDVKIVFFSVDDTAFNRFDLSDAMRRIDGKVPHFKFPYFGFIGFYAFFGLFFYHFTTANR